MPDLLRSDPVLAVADLDRSAAWYADVLGCEIHQVVPGDWTFCVGAGTTFRLGRCPDAPPVADIGDHSYLAYLLVDDVDAFHARALASGAEVRRPPQDEPWGRREMALRSPDGHRFMLGQAI